MEEGNRCTHKYYAQEQKCDTKNLLTVEALLEVLSPYDPILLLLLTVAVDCLLQNSCHSEEHCQLYLQANSSCH